ncbi:MAG: xanthine dehydrogenase family protein subunit M [Firmicutes bacterium]|nr:xanthine dehydrogenase family protein subunit M [Bacillota bacterium]
MHLHQPETLEEALEILSRDPENAKVLAGGQSLMVLLRSGLLRPDHLVSLRRIEKLQAVAVRDNVIRLGAMVTIRALETSPVVRQALPMISEAAASIGSIPIRNLGTLAGNLCHALIGADLPPSLIALGATIRVVSARGRRTIAAEQFFRGVMQTALEADEIVEAIDIPLLPLDGWGQAYVKVSQRTVDPALIGVAVVLRAEGSTIGDIAIAVGGAGEAPVRACCAERAFRGQPISWGDQFERCLAIRDDVECIADTHASAWYRREILPAVLHRAMARAVRRAREATVQGM